jgi:hypothetical protein
MDVFSIWAEESEKAYEEGNLFVLTMHPKYIGHRSRMAMLVFGSPHTRISPFM